MNMMLFFIFLVALFIIILVAIVSVFVTLCIIARAIPDSQQFINEIEDDETGNE